MKAIGYTISIKLFKTDKRGKIFLVTAKTVKVIWLGKKEDYLFYLWLYMITIIECMTVVVSFIIHQTINNKITM